MQHKAMDCVDVLVRVQDLVSGRLPPVEREAVERHLHTCHTCAAAAVSRVHSADERALWEGMARVVASRAILHQSADARPAAILRKAPAQRRPVLHDAPPRLMLRVRVFRVLAAIQVGLILVIAVVTASDWNTFLGLERWQSPTANAAPAVSVASTPPENQAVRLMDEVSAALAAVALPPGGDATISRNIAESGIPSRLCELRSCAPAFTVISSEIAKLEAFLLRAQAAGNDPAEWHDLRKILLRENLARTCDDLRIYFDLSEGAGEF